MDNCSVSYVESKFENGLEVHRLFVDNLDPDKGDYILMVDKKDFDSQSKLLAEKEQKIKELEEANANCISLSLHDSRMLSKEAEIKRLREACKMALDAFGKNHAIDWSLLEEALSGSEEKK